MGMTRKDYVVAVTEQVQANPKAVLQGHGLKPQFLKILSERPDALAKLAMFAWTSKLFKKGKNALRKGKNFKIHAYKNFADFNFQARQDVESFMEGLSAQDAETFSNSENIVTILVLPDTATGDTESDIANGKSVIIPFDKSILKQYKIPGGVYFTVSFGNSYVLQRIEKVAEAKESINNRVVERTTTPAKIRTKLMDKAKAKAALAKLKAERSKLELEAAGAQAGLQQFAELGKVAGGDISDPSAMVKAIKAYNKANSAMIEELSEPDRKLYNQAVTLLRKGKKVEANRLLREIGVPEITEFVESGAPISTDALAESKIKTYRAEIKKLNTTNAMLMERLENATTAKAKADTRFAIRKNSDKIKVLRARITTLKGGVSVDAVKNKAALLKATNKAIEENIAKGANIQTALQMAISKLPVTVEQKQQIRQEIVSQVANGTPVQFAVQQSLQNVVATTQQFQQDFDTVDVAPDAIYNENLDDDDTFGTYSDEGEEFYPEELDSLSSSLLGSRSIADILKSL